MVSYVRGRTGGRSMTDEEIAAAYADGEDSTSLGLRANCDSVTVLKIVRQQGGTVRGRGAAPRKQLPLTDAEIVRLYKSGISGPVIADRLGVTANTVYRIVRMAGVRLRNGGAVSSAMAAAARARKHPPKDPP